MRIRCQLCGQENVAYATDRERRYWRHAGCPKAGRSSESNFALEDEAQRRTLQSQSEADYAITLADYKRRR